MFIYNLYPVILRTAIHLPEAIMRIPILVFLFALLTACATPDTGRSDAGKAKEEVAAATQAWRAAYDSRDPQRISAQYAQDAVFWGTTSKTVRPTPETIMEYFADARKRPDARVEIVEQHIQIYGDVGINTGLYNFSDVRDGKRVPNPSRFSMVFQKRGDRWVLVQHHSSRLP
jgi:uncharacterized protein (TIGR02246 family)